MIRLLGGDRAEIEKATNEQWNQIVDEKKDKDRIADMTQEIAFDKGKVIINLKNHHEGSAPLTAVYFERILSIG